MRVLIVLTYYLPYWTGLTRYAVNVAEGLQKAGENIEVACVRHDSSHKTGVVNGVRVHRYPYLLRISRTLLSPLLMIGLINRVRLADRVIVFLPFAELLWVVMLVKLFRKNLLLVHNGDLVLPAGIVNRLVEWFYFFSTAIAISVSKGIVIHTKDYALNSKLLSRFPDKWRVILPPLNFSPRPRKDRTKEKLAGEYRVGFAGRFVEEKGFDILLKAIPVVLLKYPKARFVFAGETRISYENYFERLKELREKVEGSIEWLGLLPWSEVNKFYADIDLFVVSSRTDCFPFTQIEALVTGVPTVVTDIPGARWLIKETGMGKIVRSNDPEELARAIICLLENDRDYSVEHRRLVDLFDDTSAIKKFKNLLHE